MPYQSAVYGEYLLALYAGMLGEYDAPSGTCKVGRQQICSRTLNVSEGARAACLAIHSVLRVHIIGTENPISTY